MLRRRLHSAVLLYLGIPDKWRSRGPRVPPPGVRERTDTRPRAAHARYKLANIYPDKDMRRTKRRRELLTGVTNSSWDRYTTRRRTSESLMARGPATSHPGRPKPKIQDKNTDRPMGHAHSGFYASLSSVFPPHPRVRARARVERVLRALARSHRRVLLGG